MTPEERRLITMYKLRVANYQRSIRYLQHIGDTRRVLYWMQKIEDTEAIIRMIESGIYASVIGGAK